MLLVDDHDHRDESRRRHFEQALARLDGGTLFLEDASVAHERSRRLEALWNTVADGHVDVGVQDGTVVVEGRDADAAPRHSREAVLEHLAAARTADGGEVVIAGEGDLCCVVEGTALSLLDAMVRNPGSVDDLLLEDTSHPRVTAAIERLFAYREDDAVSPARFEQAVSDAVLARDRATKAQIDSRDIDPDNTAVVRGNGHALGALLATEYDVERANPDAPSPRPLASKVRAKHRERWGGEVPRAGVARTDDFAETREAGERVDEAAAALAAVEAPDRIVERAAKRVGASGPVETPSEDLSFVNGPDR